MIDIHTFVHTEHSLVNGNVQEGKGELSPSSKETIEKALKRANEVLADMSLISSESTEIIELNLVNDEQIREVNLNMRGKDASTDVISLRLSKEGEGERSSPKTKSEAPQFEEVFGEIFISLQTCEAQATEIGNTFEEELVFLLIHGILHILGFDHQTKAEEHEMMTIAYRILERGEFNG